MLVIARLQTLVGALALIGFASSALGQPSTGSWDHVPLTDLKAGVAESDITPPVGIELSGYRGRPPSNGLHDRLRMVAIVFDDGASKAAILSFDLIMLLKADGEDLKQAIHEVTGIPQDHILLNASHTHGAPALRNDEEYRSTVIRQAAQITKKALRSARPVSLGYGEGTIDFNINRRAVNDKGKAFSQLNANGPVDRRLKVLRVDAASDVEPMAVIMHAVCHPNVFRGENRMISADFPGVAKTFVEQNFRGKTTAMFLQGCGGDIRANMPPVAGSWRNGSAADMTWCAYSLGAETVKVAARLRIREQVLRRPKTFKIRAAETVLHLEAHPDRVDGATRDDIVDGKIVFPIRALAIGKFVFVGLPGEPVVEYGFLIEDDLKPLDKTVFVLGYSSGNNGYVPVRHMIAEGGYEASGPYWYTSEKLIRQGVKKLVWELFRTGD